MATPSMLRTFPVLTYTSMIDGQKYCSKFRHMLQLCSSAAQLNFYACLALWLLWLSVDTTTIWWSKVVVSGRSQRRRRYARRVPALRCMWCFHLGLMLCLCFVCGTFLLTDFSFCLVRPTLACACRSVCCVCLYVC